MPTKRKKEEKKLLLRSFQLSLHQWAFGLQHLTIVSCLDRAFDKVVTRSEVKLLFYSSNCFSCIWIMVPELKSVRINLKTFSSDYFVSKWGKKDVSISLVMALQLGGKIILCSQMGLSHFHGHLEAQWPQILVKKQQVYSRLPVFRARDRWLLVFKDLVRVLPCVTWITILLSTASYMTL